MKENITNVCKIALFFILLGCFYYFLTYFKKPYNVDLENISGFYSENKNSLDVVYVGGSAAFVYWEALEAYQNEGIVSYPFASNAIQADLYSYMVKEIHRTQKPELIVLDARAFQYRDFDQPVTSVSYRNVLTGAPFSIDKFKFIEEYVPKYLKEDTLSYHLDLNLYHSVKTLPSFKKTIDIMTYHNKQPYKGFTFVPSAVKLKTYEFFTKNEQPPSDETVEILDDLLDYLKEQDSKILFVVSPYVEMEDEKEVFNYISRRIREAGFDFLDANDYIKDMNLNYDTDFYDYNHVNILGADKYTRFLSKYIKGHYGIPDRREDERYSEWTNLLENWNISANGTRQTVIGITNEGGYNEKIHIKE